MKKVLFLFLIVAGFLSACNEEKTPALLQTVYTDTPFVQDYSIKYTNDRPGTALYKTFADRNGVIKILSSAGLMQPFSGELLYSGTLEHDGSYPAMNNKKIASIAVYKNQFVFLDDKAIFSNAWAGKLYSTHHLPAAHLFAGGDDFDFLISDGKTLQYISDSKVLWQSDTGAVVKDILYDTTSKRFFVLGPQSVSYFSPAAKTWATIFKGDNLTCFTLTDNGKNIIAGTHDGCIVLDAASGHMNGGINNKLPCPDISTVADINGKLWFGSAAGAFMLKEDGKFNYYASGRWLPSDSVIHISKGPDSSVLVLTNAGLGKICFTKMTLADKAAFYDKQVRQRHIRYGFYCDVTRLKNGDIASDELGPHDSDNLWTAMYLGSQLFRYLVTHDAEARQNCIESFDAMERLYTIHSIKGYFGRSYERHGVVAIKDEYRDYLANYWYPGYEHSVSWHQAENKEWDWRGASSSDQAVGQMFALTLVAQYMDDEAVRKRAIKLMDELMSYIVDHNLSLIDADGKPTLWGIWSPDYVNRLPQVVGDRKLYSSNIIAFLQAAYHFTGKEKYKKAADELLYKYGYLENLMRPFSEVGKAPANADAWSRDLSGEWNHSDDEMYFLAYWSLYPYAFNDSLKAQYAEAIRDHWQMERPEKNALWNFSYAMTGADQFDLNESIWHLKEMPLDMIEWSIHNSSRKDIQYIPENFWGQTTEEVLPPDERPELKHNRNLFKLDRESNGNAELGAGDTWLLPYWMGRYLQVIK